MDSGDMKFNVPSWLSFVTWVLFWSILEAIPKSISFKVPFTIRKLAGFKSR